MKTHSSARPWVLVTGSVMALSSAMVQAQSVPARKGITQRIEALEQMRALWHGHRIAVHLTSEAPGPGVDTPEDLERVRRLF